MFLDMLCGQVEKEHTDEAGPSELSLGSFSGLSLGLFPRNTVSLAKSCCTASCLWVRKGQGTPHRCVLCFPDSGVRSS